METFWSQRIAPLLRAQFVRYLIVGGANTGFSLFVYWTMLWLGFTVPLASMASLIIGILVSFAMQSHFVFDDRRLRNLLPYLVVWGVLYAFNLGVIELLMHEGMNAYLAGLLSAPATVLLSYFLQRSFVFRRRR